MRKLIACLLMAQGALLQASYFDFDFRTGVVRTDVPGWVPAPQLRNPVASPQLGAAAANLDVQLRDRLLNLASRRFLVTVTQEIQTHDAYIRQHPGLLDAPDLNDGNTLLHYAVIYSNPGAFDFLLRRGVRWDIRNNRGQTVDDLIKGKTNFEAIMQPYRQVAARPGQAASPAVARDSKESDALLAHHARIQAQQGQPFVWGHGECDVCMADSQELYKCACGQGAICLKDLTELCKTNLHTPSKIKCTRCNRPWPFERVEQGLRTKLIENLAKEATKASPDGKFCPTPNCQHFYIDRVPKAQYQIIQCPQCKVDYCTHCLIKHGRSVTCEAALKEQKQKSIDPADEEWIRLNTQPCPNCNKRIEKNGGCSHMHCKQCDHHFTWTPTAVQQADQHRLQWEVERAQRLNEEAIEIREQEREFKEIAEFEARGGAAPAPAAVEPQPSGAQPVRRNAVLHMLQPYHDQVMADEHYNRLHPAEAQLMEAFGAFMEGQIHIHDVREAFNLADLQIELPNSGGMTFDVAFSFAVAQSLERPYPDRARAGRYRELIELIAGRVQSLPVEVLVNIQGGVPQAGGERRADPFERAISESVGRAERNLARLDHLLQGTDDDLGVGVSAWPRNQNVAPDDLEDVAGLMAMARRGHAPVPPAGGPGGGGPNPPMGPVPPVNPVAVPKASFWTPGKKIGFGLAILGAIVGGKLYYDYRQRQKAEAENKD